jgi:hypothetical protein
MTPQQHKEVAKQYPLIPVRVCTKCNQPKLAIFFYDGKEEEYYRDSWCMVCRRKYGKEARDRRWYARVR